MIDSILYSLGLLFIFIGKLLKCMFPVLWVLVPFAWFSRKSVQKLSVFRFFIIFILLDLLFRLLLFFGGIPFQMRYFLPLTICAIIFAGPGFMELKNILVKYAAIYAAKNEKNHWLRWFTQQNVMILLLSVAFIACVGKAMRTKFDKKWIREIPRIIQKHCPVNEKPVLISVLEEPRMGYYADAEFLKYLPMKDHLNDSNITIIRSNKLGLKSVGKVLNDRDVDTGIKLHKGDVIDIELKTPYPSRKGFLYFDWNEAPVEEIEVKVESPEGKGRGWQSVYRGNGKRETRIAKVKHTKHLRVFVKSECYLNDIDLNRFEKWKILRRGEGYNSDGWYFLKFPGGIENLAGNIAKLGGKRVFILVKSSKGELKKLFDHKKLPLPVIFLGEFKIRKKGIFSLYQGCGTGAEKLASGFSGE